MIRMFFSLRTTAVLLLVLAGVLGSITAFEAADTPPGQYRGTYHMYGSWWFAALLMLFFLNLLGSLLRRRMRRWGENLFLHSGLGLVLLGAFFSWRCAERGMVYLSQGQQSNALEVSDRLWIEREAPDGELTRIELPRWREPQRDSLPLLNEEAGGIRLLSFFPHARVDHVPRPVTKGSGVPAIMFTIVTPHGGHELLLAGGFQEEAEVEGLRVILAPSGVQADQQPLLVVRTPTEEEVVPLDLPEDVGRTFSVVTFELEILEYAPEFTVGQPADLERPATNPALLVGIYTEDGAADTVRVFSRFPGFSRPQVPGLTDVTFVMPSRPSRRLHVYPDSLDTWRFAFSGEGETVTNTMAPGDTFFVGQGARLPMAVKALMADAEVVPRVASSLEGPAAVGLELESSDEPIWLIKDGPDVLVPTEDGQTAILRLVHTAPLPFWIRLDEATRGFYPNSSIPRVYASSLRVGTTPETYGSAQTLETNAPLSYRGWRIYQSDYGENDGRSWSGLQLAKDPGAPMAGVGVLLLLLGILVRAGRQK
jgi:hypothetical protein